jgi:hypothetical protein
MHKKECLGRTGRYTSEYRSTFTISHRYEMPSGEVYYFTQEAVDNASLDNREGHCVVDWKNDTGLCRVGGSISVSQKTLLKSALNRNNLEPFQTVIVMEYEVDYE